MVIWYIPRDPQAIAVSFQTFSLRKVKTNTSSRPQTYARFRVLGHVFEVSLLTFRNPPLGPMYF